MENYTWCDVVVAHGCPLSKILKPSPPIFYHSHREDAAPERNACTEYHWDKTNLQVAVLFIVDGSLEPLQDGILISDHTLRGNVDHLRCSRCFHFSRLLSFPFWVMVKTFKCPLGFTFISSCLNKCRETYKRQGNSVISLSSMKNELSWCLLQFNSRHISCVLCCNISQIFGGSAENGEGRVWMTKHFLRGFLLANLTEIQVFFFK